MDLEQLKKVHAAYIGNKYKDAIREGTSLSFGVDRSIFVATKSSLNDYNLVLSTFVEGEDFILDGNGERVYITKAELSEIVTGMAAWGKSAWRKRVELQQQITAAETVEEVEAVQW